MFGNKMLSILKKTNCQNEEGPPFLFLKDGWTQIPSESHIL